MSAIKRSVNRFLVEVDGASDGGQLDFAPIKRALSDLIVFVLPDGVHPDPLQRGGRPKRSRQNLFRDQGVYEGLMDIVSVPFEKKLFAVEGLKRTDDIVYTCELAMRLVTLSLMDNMSNKLRAVPFVPMLQTRLGRYPFNVAQVLTQVFADNDYLLYLRWGSNRCRLHICSQFINRGVRDSLCTQAACAEGPHRECV